MISPAIERPRDWLDDRLGIAKGTRKLINKIFPDHWSFMLGEIALYSFIILVLTGIFLTLYFIPSTADTIYNGVYKPLDGQHVSEAYASTVDISFAVRFGLLVRQMHHWAADVFVAAIAVHMCRIFFTGAFRRPRELNWLLGVQLLILGIVNGYIGYSLPDDLVSGTGIRIAFSILLSLPIVGSYLAFWLFGGNFPGTLLIPRFFIIHVFLLPLIILGLISAHLGLMVHQKHTQYPSRVATEKNVVGVPAWPTFAFKTLGMFLFVAAATAILGGFAQINPIWQYGTYIPYHVSYAVQPDWYMGWLDGALRIFPSWETVFPGNHMIPTAFYPAIVFPGITFTLFSVWPFIESLITGEGRTDHHILDRPRDRPVRTAFGAATLAFYFVLFAASSTDVLANYFGVSLNLVLWSFRAAIFVVPLVVAPVTYRICVELQHWEGSGERKRAGIIHRTVDGSYYTVESEVRPGDYREELTPIEVPGERLEVFANGDGDGDGDGQAVEEEHVGVGGVRTARRAPRAWEPGGVLSPYLPKRNH